MPDSQTTYKPGQRRAKISRRGQKWQLGADDHSIVWRDGRPQLVVFSEATENELATGLASVEAQVVSTLDDFLQARNLYLNEVRRQECIAHMIAACWMEAKKFNGKGRIGGFVVSRLRWRMFDWMRTELRAYYDGDLSLNVTDDDLQIGGWQLDGSGDSGPDAAGGRNVSGVQPEIADGYLASREVAERVDPVGDYSALDLHGCEFSDVARRGLAVSKLMSAGYSMAEVARLRRMPSRKVAAELEQLRIELRAQGIA